MNRTVQLRHLPDDEIIRRVRKGDINAFEGIVIRYESNVANIIYGILGNNPHAEDLGQEVFIRAFRGLSTFRHKAQFKTYLTRIAINVCADEIKKKTKYKSPVQYDEQQRDILQVDYRDDYDIRDLVHSALYQLDGDQRAVVVFRIMEGYSTKETARLLKIPEGTVLSRLSRGLDRLRRILNREWLLMNDETK